MFIGEYISLESSLRDAAAGKGFAMNIVDASSTGFKTLNKTLAKRQSTGTFFRHPENPDLLRLPTVAEHARGKGFSPSLVEGVTQTFGHEALGQSICKGPFRAAGKLLGQWLCALAKQAHQEYEAMMTSLVQAARIAA